MNVPEGLLEKCVRVVWTDSFRITSTTWLTRSALEKVTPSKIVTVGFVVKIGSDFVIITDSVSVGKDTVSMPLCIPFSSVDGVEEMVTKEPSV